MGKKPTKTDVGATEALPDATATTAPESPLPTPDGKNPAAVALGRLGGLKGGKARAAKLTKKQRSEIAKRAARARWAAKGKPEGTLPPS